MMRRWRTIITFLSVATAGLRGQISPGELSKAHQHLEGIEHCTKCHTIGKALSNDNCLTCHREIRVRLAQKTGYHASVAGKQCVDCHKEHHGRDFSIIHFNRSAFNHSQVGFSLEHKHATLKCEQCHTPSNIRAKDILALSEERRATTMLGLSKECSACHRDEHRGQFTVSCNHCHGTKEWKSAEKFSHTRTRFPLIGAHAKVECVQCHKRTWNGGTAMQFVKMEFVSCASCHTDPHKGRFAKECAQCHSPVSWRKIKGKEFDHAMTAFPLKGKHAMVKCEQCHAKSSKDTNVSGEVGFKITRFHECRNCHADAHAQQFDHRADRGRCEACHNESRFTPTLFSLAEHQTTRFPLTGAHRAVPCIKCHQEGKVQAKSTKIFRWGEIQTCTTCHTDIHQGQFAGKMPNGCETCHSTQSWEELRFSHEKTHFPLRGKHSVIDCSRCHIQNNGITQYAGMNTECSSCHKDRHAGQFAKNGKTECNACHTEQHWRPTLFDHNIHSRFALTGKHALISCAQCHKQGIVNNQRTIIYKPLGTTCVECHPAQ